LRGVLLFSRLYSSRHFFSPGVSSCFVWNIVFSPLWSFRFCKYIIKSGTCYIAWSNSLITSH
jgi:hypothetical protein